jgi:hypothetical protein
MEDSQLRQIVIGGPYDLPGLGSFSNDILFLIGA